MIGSRVLSSLFLLLLLTSCGDGRAGGDPKDSPKNPEGSAAQPIGTRDTLPARELDSVPRLKPVEDPILAADSIPLRSPDGKPARYGVGSGRVVGRFTGNARGTRTLIFDQYGLRERREENIAPWPETTAVAISNIIFITTPRFQAYGDMRSKGGFRRDVDALAPYMSSPESKTISLGEYTVLRSGARRLPDTTIAGYHCRVYARDADGARTTIWVWRGITLRQLVEIASKGISYTMEPVEIEVDVKVPESTYEFPSEYKIAPYVAQPGDRR